MDCSRCGGDLEVYSLGGREAYVCVDCGFVDTPVEHEIPERPAEPWERALERFYQRHSGDAAVVGSGETAALVEIESDTDVSPDGSADRNQENGDAAAESGVDESETTDDGEREDEKTGNEESKNSEQADKQVQ